MYRTTPFLAVFLGLLVCTVAQLPCSGTLSSPDPVTSDVTVSGGSCTIQGITITGSVQVTSGGTLTTEGSTVIQGSISASGSGAITLGGTTSVSGDVSFGDTSSTLTLGSNAVVTSISLSNGAKFVGQGTTGDIGALNAGDVTINGGTTTGGGIGLGGGSGSLTLCAATVSGGVKFVEVSGNLIAKKGTNCGNSTIIGSILVEKGTGNIDVMGAKLTGGDLSVVEQSGDVSIEEVELSDIKIDKLVGSVSLTDISTDSDVSIKGMQGPVTLGGSSISGDLAVEESQGPVNILNTDFNNETASVLKATGLVTVTGNTEISANLNENAGVIFSNNKGQTAAITKNTVNTTISNNVLNSLSCSDNSPAPTGSGNTITTATGQCTGF